MTEPPSTLFEIRTTRRVEFSDTDLSGLIHFSRYPVFMEDAEHAFRRAIGASVDQSFEGGRLGWPRLSMAFEFLRPVRFEDEVEVRVFVLKKGGKSLTFGCQIHHDGELVARGQMTSACCMFEAGRPMRAIEIPDSIASRIDEAPLEERQAWQTPIRPL